MKRARPLAVVLALMLVLAPIVPFAAVGTAAAAPPGFVTTGSEVVEQEVTVNQPPQKALTAGKNGKSAKGQGPPMHALEKMRSQARENVLASRGSIQTQWAPTANGDPALVLTDEERSGSGEVAIPVEAFESSMGQLPEAAYGVHESGEQWQTEVRVEDGHAIIDIPHFSTNTVTFSGEVMIDAQGATNNTDFSYTIGQDENVSDAAIDLMGADNTERNTVSRVASTSFDPGFGGTADPENVTVNVSGKVASETAQSASATGVGLSDSQTVTQSGNIQPGGPAGEPEITVTAHHGAGGTIATGTSPDDTVSVGNVQLEDNPTDFATEVSFNEPGKLTEITVSVYSITGDPPGVDIYLDKGTADTDYTEGTLVKSNWNPSTTGDVNVDLADTYVESGGYELQFVGDADYDDGTDEVEIDAGGTGAIWYSSGPDDYSKSGAATIDYTTIQPVDNLRFSGNDGGSVSLGDLSDGTQVTKQVDLGKNVSDVSFSGAGGGTIDWTLDYTERDSTADPRIDYDNDGTNEISVSGVVTPSETSTHSINPTLQDDSWGVSTSVGSADLSTSYTEITETKDPVVTLNSSDGTQTLSHTGTLADGQTVDLSSSTNESLISGSTTVTVNVDDPASGPAGQVDLKYSHSAQDKISTNYQASTFEESYNISHTYSDATENAQVTIPFASSRVVGVKNVEYRVDGGSWSSVSPTDYRFESTTLDLYLGDATGGVSAGQMVDVRATGRKISVENGAVSVTDPTAPGEELDTQLQVDSRSPNFHVNVGPTDDGDRVHYAYSDSFPTEDYVVIEANGDQQLYLPNSVTGDQFRVSHLDTRVVAERGDVRIDVIKAGENPELDVSSGPGGEGDPVTVEYYNTETGVTYLLNSLTRNIVVDSDMAESPAIFEDDDSEDTWSILRDSGPTGSTSDGGAIGQFRETASGAVGSFSLPIDSSGLGQLTLVGVLGIVGVVALRRLWPFGDSDNSAAVTSTTATASDSSGRLSGFLSTTASVSSQAARTTGSGLLVGLRRMLAYFGRVTAIIFGNRRASVTAAVVGAIVAARVGLFQLPEGTGILIVVSGAPLATWLIMRRSDAVSQRVWIASTIAAVILGLEFVAPGTVQTAIEQLTSEQVAPLLILVGAGAVYLWYRARQSDRPQIIIGGNNE